MSSQSKLLRTMSRAVVMHQKFFDPYDKEIKKWQNLDTKVLPCTQVSICSDFQCSNLYFEQSILQNMYITRDTAVWNLLSFPTLLVQNEWRAGTPVVIVAVYWLFWENTQCSLKCLRSCPVKKPTLQALRLMGTVKIAIILYLQNYKLSYLTVPKLLCVFCTKKDGSLIAFTL